MDKDIESEIEEYRRKKHTENRKKNNALYAQRHPELGSMNELENVARKTSRKEGIRDVSR